MAATDIPDPDLVRQTIAAYNRLTEQTFVRSVADYIVEPPDEPEVLLVERAALHSDDLVERTLAATNTLLKEVRSRVELRTGESDKAWLRRQRHFEQLVGQERQLCQSIVNGNKARRGFLSTAPNPRQQAREELQARHQEEFVAILAEIKERQKAENRARRKAKLDADRQAKAGLPPRPRRPRPSA